MKFRWIIVFFSVIGLSALVVVLHQYIPAGDYNFIFISSLGTLSGIYPNYYFEIFLITKFILVSPILFVSGLLFLSLISSLGNQLVKQLTVDTKDIKGEWILFVCVTLLSIGVYFGSRIWFDDYTAIQIFTTKAYLYVLVIYYLTLLAFNRERVKVFLIDFLFQDGSKKQLAIFRILFFGYLIDIYIEYLFSNEEIGQLAKQGLPGISWLIDILPVNSSIYEASCVIGIICCIAIVMGFKTRFFLIINAVIIFYVIAAPNFYGKMWHNQVIIWLTWIMSTSPCYHAFSVDSLLRKNQSSDGWSYVFPIKVIWIQFGMIYFFAGFYKLWICGFEWALGDSMINQIRLEWFEHNWTIPSVRVDQFPFLMNFGGLAVVFFELLFVLLILFNRTRLLAIVGGLSMHTGIAKFMYISFFRHLVVFYLFFLDKTLFVKKSIQRLSVQAVPKFRDYRIIIPMFILTGNFFCGVMNINSYPFSIYPVYAELIPPTVSNFQYVDSKGLEIEIRGRTKISGQPYESYARADYHLVRNHRHGLEITCEQLLPIWERWCSLDSDLIKYDSVKIFIIDQSLDPADSGLMLGKKPLAWLFPQIADCTFIESTN